MHQDIFIIYLVPSILECKFLEMIVLIKSFEIAVHISEVGLEV